METILQNKKFHKIRKLQKQKAIVGKSYKLEKIYKEINNMRNILNPSTHVNVINKENEKKKTKE